MMSRTTWIVAAVAVAFLATGRLEAQDTNKLNISLAPRYGQVSLKAGFLPDPHVVKVQAGGRLKVVHNGVTSHVEKNPDFKLTYTARKGVPLTFFLESKGDTTLLINLPNGKWIANDDGGRGLNAQIKLANPLSGRYDIYVGTFRGIAPIPARLEITELK